MKKSWIIVCSGLMACSLIFGSSVREVSARKEYKEEFDSMYVKKDTPLAKAVAEAKCAVCHAGESKKMRNAYGQELAKLLTKADKGNKDKIDAALKKVEDMKPNAGSPTYGELIKSGKLPVGG